MRNGSPSPERLNAFRRGHLSEYIAAAYLIAKGYRIQAIRYRTRLGEIDIIARKGALVAFIEVKARRETVASVFAVTGSAERRIRAASDLWLARQPDAATLTLRYDIVAVRPWRIPVHFQDAF